MLVTSGAALSGIGIALGALVLVVKRDLVVTLVAFAMGLFGGAFFPVDVLPSWLQPLHRPGADPLRLRRPAQRDFQGGGWEDDAAVLAGIAVVGVPLGPRAVRAGAARHCRRRTGSLA